MNNIPLSYNGKALIYTWTYRDSNGAVLGHVTRYQNGTGKKEVIPRFKHNSSGWTVGIESGLRPLFGLDRLATHPKNKAVFIPEGEKAASAFHGLGITAVSSLGGSNAVEQTDWTPLNGCKMVYLVPDNDAPGEHYAQDVYRALMALELPPEVKVLRLSDLPDKGDIVDWVQGWIGVWDGYSPIDESRHEGLKEVLRDELKNVEDVPGSWNKIGLIGSNPGDCWEKNPVEINVKLKPVNPFKFELLPNVLMPWVKDITHRMQCPPDYVAVSGMIALSAIVGKKGMITPKARDDWRVCPNLWGVNIGRPSAMKTPAASDALKPLQRLEIEAKNKFDEAIVIEEAQSFINKEGRTLAEKEAKALIKDGNFSKAKQVLMENPEEPSKPTRVRYLVNDPTIEKLGELLNENPNGLMLYRDELSGFLKTIDREDHSNDRAFYTESFDGKGTYTFDRIGRGTIDIQSVCVAMLGNIQPGVLRPYLSQAINGGSSDDGMIQRFQLMVWPNLNDWQHIDQWPDKTAKDDAYSVFTRLANWEGFEEPARFSEEAQKLFDVWFCDLHKELRSDDIAPVMESHYGKFKSLIPSLAILIHLADNPQHSVIVGADSIQKAIAWGEYLKSHAERVYSSALDPVDSNAKTILSKIETGKLKEGFGACDIVRGGWTGLDSLEAIKSAVNRLIEYGWLKLMTPKPILGAGRPSMRYQVHPKILLKHTN